MGPIRFDTVVHLWFDRINCRTPHGPRALPVPAPYGPHAGISNVSHILWDPYGVSWAPQGAVWHPYGHVRQLTQPEFAKIPHGCRIWPYGARMGPLPAPHGLLTGCLRYPNPYGARKLKMHALKLYEPHTALHWPVRE